MRAGSTGLCALEIRLNAQVFKISPEKGSLGVGETLRVTFEYEHMYVGDYIIPIHMSTHHGAP
jgi:hypothetical protein